MSWFWRRQRRDERGAVAVVTAIAATGAAGRRGAGHRPRATPGRDAAPCRCRPTRRRCSPRTTCRPTTTPSRTRWPRRRRTTSSATRWPGQRELDPSIPSTARARRARATSRSLDVRRPAARPAKRHLPHDRAEHRHLRRRDHPAWPGSTSVSGTPPASPGRSSPRPRPRGWRPPGSVSPMSLSLNCLLSAAVNLPAGLGDTLSGILPLNYIAPGPITADNVNTKWPSCDVDRTTRSGSPRSTPPRRPRGSTLVRSPDRDRLAASACWHTDPARLRARATSPVPIRVARCPTPTSRGQPGILLTGWPSTSRPPRCATRSACGRSSVARQAAAAPGLGTRSRTSTTPSSCPRSPRTCSAAPGLIKTPARPPAGHPRQPGLQPQGRGRPPADLEPQPAHAERHPADDGLEPARRPRQHHRPAQLQQHLTQRLRQRRSPPDRELRDARAGRQHLQGVHRRHARSGGDDPRRLPRRSRGSTRPRAG